MFVSESHRVTTSHLACGSFLVLYLLPQGNKNVCSLCFSCSNSLVYILKTYYNKTLSQMRFLLQIPNKKRKVIYVTEVRF